MQRKPQEPVKAGSCCVVMCFPLRYAPRRLLPRSASGAARLRVRRGSRGLFGARSCAPPQPSRPAAAWGVFSGFVALVRSFLVFGSRRLAPRLAAGLTPAGSVARTRLSPPPLCLRGGAAFGLRFPRAYARSLVAQFSSSAGWSRVAACIEPAATTARTAR